MKVIDKLIEELRLEEKASLCSGASKWSTKPVDRLGIPHINLFDGPHGFRGLDKIDAFDIPNKPGTCFPTASALASSWNRGLVGEVAAALAGEARDHNVHILLGPGVNIKRHPLGGRNFEYFSEDPFLAGEMAATYINGVQKYGIGTSLKHFTANNQEADRFFISAEISERALREIYLPAFEKAVKKAQPWTVMCAYNKINGTFGSENKYLLDEILREEWGFQGVVVSDWWATHDRIKGILAGLDLEMPGSSPLNDQIILDAVQQGRLAEDELNRVVRRILELIEKVKDSGNLTGLEEVDYEEHHNLARRAAVESMVLLKNEGKLLPIKQGEVSSIAVLGEMAVKTRYQGAGSSKVRPTKVSNVLDEIEKYINKQNELLVNNETLSKDLNNNKFNNSDKASNGTNLEIKLEYAAGYSLSGDMDRENRKSLLEEAKELAGKADRVIIFAGIPENIESEGYDRKNMEIPERQVELINKVLDIQENTIVVLNNGAAVEMKQWIDRVPVVLEGWLAGQAGPEAVTDIIFGKVNPSGKLAESFPVSLADTPAYINYPGEGGVVNYGEGIFVGYRYYDKKNIEPLFPFGHGLSYTEFEYSSLEVKRISDGKENNYQSENINNSKDNREDSIEKPVVEVKLELENTGLVTGQEVVQLYIGQDNPTIPRPVKELKGFEKIKLELGESKTITFKLSYRDFAYYNTERGRWLAENDSYQILVGSSSRDIRLSSSFQLEDGEEKSLKLSSDTPTIDWLKDKQGRKILKGIFSAEQIELIESQDYLPISDKPIYRLPSFSKGKITVQQLTAILEKAGVIS